MKKSFMTRVLATGLSLAMALSLSTATNLVSAQAAPAMLVDAVSGESTSTLTVDVDTVAKLKINPEVSKTYKVESVKKSSKKIKTAVNKKGTVVYVRGMAATGEKDSAIRVYFKVKKTGKTAKRQFTAKVKVVEATPVVEVAKITEVVQKETKKVAVKFSTAVESVKPADFTITRVDGSVAIPVKGAVIDADKTGATIETYVDMNGEKEYKVSYTAADEAKTVSELSFVATNAKVAKLDFNKTTVVAGESTEVKVCTYDANGVKLGEYKFSDLAQQKITIEDKYSVGGYRNGDKIFLKNVGDTAELKATLHTYDFENGVEKNTIDGIATITAAADTFANITWGYTFTKKQDAPAWSASTFKAATTLPINDDLYAHYHFMDGTTDKSAKFKVTSADKSIVIVNDANTADKAAEIKGVKAGSTYLIVKDEKDNVVTTLPVTVAAARKATRLALSQVSLSLSRADNQEVIWVKADVYDQYDEWMAITEDVKVTALTVADTTDGKLVAVTSKSGTNYGVKVTAAGKTKGNYYYEIEAKTANGSVKNNLNVSIADPKASSSESFDIKLGSATVDLTQNDYDGKTENKFQTIQVRRLTGGVLADYVKIASIASIKIEGTDTDNKGSLPAVASKGATETTMTVTCGAVTGAAVGNGLAQLAKSGTYLVTVQMYTDAAKTASKVSTITTTFAVKNDTPARFGINIKETDCNKSSKGLATIENVFQTAKASNDMIAYTFDGVEIDAKNMGAVVINKKATGKSVYVESVEFEYSLSGTDNKVVTYVVLPVKTTFTVKN